MNSNPEDFETLRKLIALKRHEQPPPGYFSRLPDKIASRIERGEGQESFWESVLARFTFRPAFVYGFSLAALGALTVSVVYSVRVRPDESAQNTSSDGWRSVLPEQAAASQFNYGRPLHVANWVAEGNASNPAPVLPSIFGAGMHQAAVPVSFAGSP